MGCVSSKHVRREIEREIICSVNSIPNHVVRLTSSTYGALKLDEDPKELRLEKEEDEDEPEVINTWELMKDLEEETKLKSKSVGRRSPFKQLNKLGNYSPKKVNNYAVIGKENKLSHLGFAEKEIADEFEKKCPPRGENRVVIYTSSLRSIRKTFEECNSVRSILESYQIQICERDVSMDSGFKEELRKLLMDTRFDFGIPIVFVKGRLIGGFEETSKLEEQGKLAKLLNRMEIPKRNSRNSVCEACGGVRFIVCSDCNGSCKVFDENLKDTVKCGECNENGLIHCPLCS